MTATAQRRFPWWAYGLTLLIIIVLAATPLISVLIAGSIAEANWCALDEGSIHPCIVNGADIGETLYTFAVLGWLMLATLPLGAGALLIWGIILVIHLLAQRSGRARGEPANG